MAEGIDGDGDEIIVAAADQISGVELKRPVDLVLPDPAAIGSEGVGIEFPRSKEGMFKIIDESIALSFPYGIANSCFALPAANCTNCDALESA